MHYLWPTKSLICMFSCTQHMSKINTPTCVGCYFQSLKRQNLSQHHWPLLFSRLHAGCICDAGGCHLRTSVGARVWVLLKEKGEREADGGSSCDKSESGGGSRAASLPAFLLLLLLLLLLLPFLCLSLLLCGDLVIVYFLSCLAGSFCLINEQHLNRTKRAEEIAFNCKKVSLTFPSLHPHSLIFIWVFFFIYFFFFCLCFVDTLSKVGDSVWLCRSGRENRVRGASLEMLRTGTHVLYLLSIEESCKKPCSYQCQQRAHFLAETKKKRNVFQPASAPLRWEQGKLSV